MSEELIYIVNGKKLMETSTKYFGKMRIGLRKK